MTERTNHDRSTSLRGQLAALVAALAVPLLALQAWWSYHDYTGARERAEVDALAFADATALGVRQFFSTAEELTMATASQLGSTWLTEVDCVGEMTEVKELFPFLHDALAVDAQGRIACSATRGATRGATTDATRDATRGAADRVETEWPWFEGIMRAPRFTLGPPAEGVSSSIAILPMVAPIIGDDGAFEGAIVGTVALTELSRLFGGVTVPETHLVTVATADRIVIARSHDAPERVGHPLPPNTGTDREVAPGRWVATGPDLNGVPRTWGQIQIEPGWLIYVGVPDEVVYGPALREARLHMGASLLVVILAILFASRSHARIARALRELASRMHATASGDIVPLPEGTPTEVRAVVEQFNRTLRARDRAETAERKARERFQSIFDNAVFGMYVSTIDGRFLQVNPALVSILGYESEEALLEAGPAALYVHAERRPELIGGALLSESVGSHELEWLRADGIPIVVRVAGKVIEGPGGEPVFEMVVEDITDQKRTEDELRQTQKMEAIGQLAGGIAHDFNNLLTVIAGNVELLEDDVPLDAPLREDLKQIAKATNRATSLTRRLLAFSRRDQRAEQVLDVNQVIPELSRMIVPLIGETVVLETDLDPQPLPICIDPGELEQVVLNLVLNARDAMPGGGRVVVATRRAARLESDGWKDDGTSPVGVTLTVKDNGVGMDAATRPRIFEPFYTTKPMGEGTGLGLSTVYGIVKRSGGTISVESDLGVGTCIQLWFPMAMHMPVGKRAVEEIAFHGGDERVLVVEDDDLVRDFVRRALEEAGYAVLTASSGNAALDMVEGRPDDVDLVLTDVVMPGLGGPELAERLAVIAPNTPVLFMSGYVDRPFADAELLHHRDSLLRKPFSAVELRRRIRRKLDHRGAAPSAT